MIEDHLAGLVEAERVVGVALGVATGPHADVAHDDVRAVGERDFSAFEADAAAGRALAGDREIALRVHGGFQLYVAADIEDDDAVTLAHGVAKRAGARVVQARDVIDLAVAAAGRVPGKALSAGERDIGRRGGSGGAAAR